MPILPPGVALQILLYSALIFLSICQMMKHKKSLFSPIHLATKQTNLCEFLLCLLELFYQVSFEE